MRILTTVMIVVGFLAAGQSSAEVVRWIPAAASNPGNAGTYWKTDVWITNLVADSVNDIHIALLAEPLQGSEPEEVTVELPPRGTVFLEDIVGSLLAKSRPGALRLRAHYPFEAQSRTYNSARGNGTFGQAIPAIPDPESEWRWFLMGATNQPTEDGVRSNIGFFNMASSERSPRITVVCEDTGEVIGMPDTEVAVGGYGWFQANVFELVGAADAVVENATIRVRASPGVWGYLSRIYNLTGDGAFFQPIEEKYILYIPAEWETTLTVRHSPGVSLDAIVYTGSEGWDLVAREPESGWSDTVGIMSPAEFCYEVRGSGDGQLTIEVVQTRGNGPGGISFSRLYIFGGDTSTVDKCFHLW